MVDSIKIKFNDTTYVDENRPNGNFYKEEKLIVGTINNALQNSNHYKALLRFHISDLNYDSVDSIYLFLFVENIKLTNSKDANIGISGTINASHISSINWNTFPQKSTSKQINLSIPYEAIGKYIKIDISTIIKSLTPYNNIYNLTIESMNFNSISIIHFASNNSSNSPYVIISNNIHKEENDISSPYDNKDYSYYTKSNFVNLGTDFKNDNVDLNTDFKNNDINEIIYNKIFSKLNDQDLKLNLLEEKYKYLSDHLSNLNDNIGSLHTKVDNLVNKIDIFNTNIDTPSEKSDYILDESVSELTQSMYNLTSSLSKISEPILNLIEIMESVKIESLDSSL